MTNPLRRPIVARLAMCGSLLAALSVVGAGQSSKIVYPEIYRARQLPELPGATMVSVGRQTSSLRDGLRIQLTSSRPLADVRDFYRNTLVAAGWKEQGTPAARGAQTNSRLAVLSLFKERLTYAVTIVAPPNAAETQVTINVVER